MSERIPKDDKPYCPALNKDVSWMWHPLYPKWNEEGFIDTRQVVADLLIEMNTDMNCRGIDSRNYKEKQSEALTRIIDLMRERTHWRQQSEALDQKNRELHLRIAQLENDRESLIRQVRNKT